MPTVCASICDYIQRHLVDQSIPVEPDTDLNAVGIDSFSLMSIILFVEKTWSIQMAIEKLTPENTATPAALAACVTDS